MLALKLSCINRLLFIKSNIHYVKNLAPMVQTLCYYVLTLVMESGYWECGGCGCTIAHVQNSKCKGVWVHKFCHILGWILSYDIIAFDITMMWC